MHVAPLALQLIRQVRGVVLLLDPEGGSQKATVVVLVLVISSQKIPKAFLIRSGAQRNFAYIHADIAHRSTVSDFSLIF